LSAHTDQSQTSASTPGRQIGQAIVEFVVACRRCDRSIAGVIDNTTDLVATTECSGPAPIGMTSSMRPRRASSRR
jgi:hypothetical protein